MLIASELVAICSILFVKYILLITIAIIINITVQQICSQKETIYIFV